MTTPVRVVQLPRTVTSQRQTQCLPGGRAELQSQLRRSLRSKRALRLRQTQRPLCPACHLSHNPLAWHHHLGYAPVSARVPQPSCQLGMPLSFDHASSSSPLNEMSERTITGAKQVLHDLVQLPTCEIDARR